MITDKDASGAHRMLKKKELTEFARRCVMLYILPKKLLTLCRKSLSRVRAARSGEAVSEAYR